MLYRNEKFKQIILQQIQVVWQTAVASRKRTCWLGGLATLAWIACVTQLKLQQQSKSIMPHAIAICAAYSIGGTIKRNLQVATNTQKSVIQMRKNLKKAQTTDELRQIYQDLNKLENQFIFKATRQKN